MSEKKKKSHKKTGRITTEWPFSFIYPPKWAWPRLGFFSHMANFPTVFSRHGVWAARSNRDMGFERLGWIATWLFLPHYNRVVGTKFKYRGWHKHVYCSTSIRIPLRESAKTIKRPMTRHISDLLVKPTFFNFFWLWFREFLPRLLLAHQWFSKRAEEGNFLPHFPHGKQSSDWGRGLGDREGEGEAILITVNTAGRMSI